MKHDFLDRYSNLESPVHKLDVRVKLVSFLTLIVICVTTPADLYAAFPAYFALVLVMIAASKVPAGYVFKRALIVLPFVFMVAVFIPFFNRGSTGGAYNLGDIRISAQGLLVFWNVLAKATVSVLTVILLSSSTPFPVLLRGLEALKVPALLISITAFMYRYVFVLTDEAERMKMARDSRNYGARWFWQAGAVGSLIGTLFIRSYERAERVYLAMLSRGYNGKNQPGAALHARPADFLFMIAFIFLALSVRMGVN